MRRSFVVYSVLLSMIWAALLTGTASAAPAAPAEEVGAPVGFELRGTHGYAISGSAYLPGPGRRGEFALTAQRGDEAVTYSVAAKVTANSIRANLGSLGRVDLSLRRSGEEKSAHVKCLHYSESYEAGTWEGLIEFNGEGGYSRARATQAVGLPILLLFAKARICQERSSGETFGPGVPGARLKGVSYADGRTVRFQINKNRRGGKTLFTASLAERERGIHIYRKLGGIAPAAAFRYDRRVRTATLDPPAPFAGSAHLRRSRNAVSPFWTGNLTLAFPGRTVPLAGPDFHVSLEHARQTHGNDSGNITVGI